MDKHPNPPLNLNVNLNYGHTIQKSEMQPNHIYLDGACRGPAVSNKDKSYSFDHHHDCLRLVTLSTCEQVLVALELGFNPSNLTVEINDLDADTSVALWLLRNPTRWKEEVIQDMVKRIGFIDCHGPSREPMKLHRCLTHDPRIQQTNEMIAEDQELIDKWVANPSEDVLPEPFVYPPAPQAFGITSTGQFREYTDVTGFEQLYIDSTPPIQGMVVVAILCSEAPNGTIGYTVAKKSEFVNFNIPDFLSRCNKLEAGWGGGSTIGGAPRHEDGTRSKLSYEEVKQIFVDMINPNNVVNICGIKSVHEHVSLDEIPF